MKHHHLTARAAALLLVVALLAAALLALSACKKNEETEEQAFDYLTSDLSAYISLPREKFVGHTISLEVDEVSDLDVQNKILQERAAHKSAEPLEKGAYLTDRTVSAGDVVYIYYRGYQIGEDGKVNDLYALTSNFAASDGASPFNQTPDTLEIGSGSMILGFELGLLGKNPKNYAALHYVDAGTVRPDDVIYVTYDAVTSQNGGALLQNQVARIDLNDETVDERFGEGFKDMVVGMNIGITKSFSGNLKIDGDEDIHYGSVKVNFVTRRYGSLAPLVIETYFPDDYRESSLAGQTVLFEVYIEKVQAYDAPEVDETFVRETLGLTDEDLSAYEGDIVARYEAHVRAGLEEERNDEIVVSAQEKMWAFLKDVAEIKQYPKAEEDRIFNQNKAALESSYKESYSKMYASFDEFAVAYYGLETGDDWAAYLTSTIRDEIRERLIEYLIMRTEGFVPSAEEVERRKNAVLEELFDYYAERLGVLRERYDSDEAYEADKASAKQEILQYYTDEYFTEMAYYEYVSFPMLRLFRITVNGESYTLPDPA